MPAVVMSTVAVDTTPVEKIAIVGALALVAVALAAWLRKRQTRA
jgi:MYXO-CTERM domain-containing protein